MNAKFRSLLMVVGSPIIIVTAGRIEDNWFSRLVYFLCWTWTFLFIGVAVSIMFLDAGKKATYEDMNYLGYVVYFMCAFIIISASMSDRMFLASAQVVLIVVWFMGCLALKEKQRN